jgi:hypothetical protein
MLSFASYFAQLEKYANRVVPTEYGSLYETLCSFGMPDSIAQTPPSAPLLADSWLSLIFRL